MYKNLDSALYKLQLGSKTSFTGLSKELEVDLNASTPHQITNIDLVRSCKVLPTFILILARDLRVYCK